MGDGFLSDRIPLARALSALRCVAGGRRRWQSSHPRSPAPTTRCRSAVGRASSIDGDTFCTLTTIGNDSRGNLIGFTSAHCGGPGAQVAAEARRGPRRRSAPWSQATTASTTPSSSSTREGAPVNNVNGFQIDGLGPDPAFGDVACKLGRTTGYSCGVTWGPGEEPGTIVNQVCGQPGDSGAPVTVNNRLVGMIHGAFSRGPADVRGQVRPAAHPGGHDVDQRACSPTSSRRAGPDRVSSRSGRRRRL